MRQDRDKLRVYEDGTIRYWSRLQQRWYDRVAPTSVLSWDRAGLTVVAQAILDGAARVWLERYPGTID